MNCFLPSVTHNCSKNFFTVAIFNHASSPDIINGNNVIGTWRSNCNIFIFWDPLSQIFPLPHIVTPTPYKLFFLPSVTHHCANIFFTFPIFNYASSPDIINGNDVIGAWRSNSNSFIFWDTQSQIFPLPQIFTLTPWKLFFPSVRHSCLKIFFTVPILNHASSPAILNGNDVIGTWRSNCNIFIFWDPLSQIFPLPHIVTPIPYKLFFALSDP